MTNPNSKPSKTVLPVLTTSAFYESKDLLKTVIIKSDEGHIIRQYDDDSKQGFIVLGQTHKIESVGLKFNTSRFQGRTTLVKGDVRALESDIADWTKLGRIPFNLIVHEYTEDELIQILGDDDLDNFEEDIKIHSRTKEPLLKNGKPIYRIINAIPDSEPIVDITIKHDGAINPQTPSSSNRLDQ